MKMKFSLLSACLMLLATGSWNVAFGQVQGTGSIQTPPTNSGQNCTGSITTGATLDPEDNNFGPGEAGILTPLPSGHSPNAGRWDAGYGNTNDESWNPFYMDDGRITVGGTLNIVEFTTNLSFPWTFSMQ